MRCHFRVLFASALLLPACTPTAPPAGLSRPGAAPTPRLSAPIAQLGPELLKPEDLAPYVYEAAGNLALEELLLDRMLKARLAERAITLSPQQLDQQAANLRQSIMREARADENAAQDLLDRITRRRGLGPVRFQALVFRTAALRALVQDSVILSPQQIDQEWAIATSPRFRVRILTTATFPQAAGARDQVLSGDPSPDAVSSRFARLAFEQSTDASASSGGLVDGLSPIDPALPTPIRAALASCTPGQVSDVLLLDQGFALLLPEAELPPTTTDTPEAREEVRERLRQRLERLAMDQAARDLLRSAQLTVLEPSLAWSWSSRTQ